MAESNSWTLGLKYMWARNSFQLLKNQTGKRFREFSCKILSVKKKCARLKNNSLLKNNNQSVFFFKYNEAIS